MVAARAGGVDGGLSPPVTSMVLQGFATLLVHLRRRLGVVGELALAVIGTAYAIDALDGQRPADGAFERVVAVGGIALAATMAILALREIVRRWWLRRTIAGDSR